MRFFLLILSVLSISFNCLFAQNLKIEKQIISFSGGFEKSSNGQSLSYTSGEACINTKRSQGSFYSLAEGFQQPIISNPFQNNCAQLTFGGTIKGDEVLCLNEQPQPIFNDQLPQGGVGTMEFKWLSSETGCPNNCLLYTSPSPRD